VWNRLPAFDPSRELHRVPAPWITTATRPGVRAPCVGAAGKRTAADHNCIPARRWESLTCIRSIEGTASSPGPMDHNCNPARCACSLRGCCGKTHRSGSQLQPGPALGIAYLHSIHRGNCIESRPHGSQLQPGPVCVLVRETWPAADHNRNPARCASLDESTHGSNAIEYRPAADPQLQPGPVCVAR
jgi:hypothetical protein